MNEKKKSKVLPMDRRAREGRDSGERGPTGLFRPKLRSNEWLRLLSITNKQQWRRPLTLLDERDHREIKAIEAGRLAPFRPEAVFLNPACTWFRDGLLCWIQDSESPPFRELTAHERRLWDIVGSWELFGYIRPDGSIQAFILSGWDRVESVMSWDDSRK